jgi:signal peptidase I
MKQIRKFARKHKGLLVCAAVAVLAAFIISKCFVQLVLIRDASMEPAYHNGQIVAVSKGHHDYQVGDVIVFEAPQLNCRLVKRIAHVPGDHLSPEEAALYGRGTLAGYTLPEGTYLVLGDNAEESVDSRDSRVGIVSERQIVGVVLR